MRQQNERESERAKEAMTKNDEAGYPMPESKKKINKMSGDERMSQWTMLQKFLCGIYPTFCFSKVDESTVLKIGLQTPQDEVTETGDKKRYEE